ncbi:MAG TPA: M13 family metallopeptidase [Bryobacteraceae bacterium]|nr:M13 family metallopeptidase [Bryobacteraceae bacterium]
MTKLTVAIVFCLSSLALRAQTQLKPGFDINALDRKADPCVDFYQYACGTWLAANPIPPDQSSWGRFSALLERNQRILKDILETSAAKTAKNAGDGKVGDYYSSCMDEQGIEARGTAPLKPELDRIAALADKPALVDELIRLHKLGVNALFNLSSGQDFKDSTEVIAQADQGGLGLPDRDYYFKQDPKSVETRGQYVGHVQKMFELLGDSPEKAAANAKVVMAIETALAKGSQDRVTRRDPAATYHRMSTKELQALYPSFAWPKYLQGVGVPRIQSLNVVAPDFFKQMDSQIQEVALEDWKVYLRWHYLSASAPLLPARFVNQNFEFSGKILTGAKELKPRWKRCVQFTDGDLGEALGQKYVEQTFGAEGKERTLKMVHALEKALERDIERLSWMTPATKKRALEKLHAITNKIGFPEKWRDYSALTIQKGDALGNSTRANTFEFQRQLAKIGKPVDKTEWFMTPPTVNAYYDPQLNNINFPAGILQPPFYDNKLDDAVNFGGIGAVIGHELTHGFDDQGRQFDAKGNLADWWTEADAKEFERRADCVNKEYGEFAAVGDLKLNGKLTLGENVADNGGLRIAYMAMIDTLAGKSQPKIDGFTAEQRIFLGWGQIWCTNMTDQALRLRTQTDPHSPGRYRVNGTVSNMPEFQKAFACKAGQPMVRQNACSVW